MGILHRRWIWLKRFRHRRGYGVHSPSAFSFLESVVYERGCYYAYEDLRKRFFVPAYWWGGHVVKCRKFLFRLANYVQPVCIRLVGEADEASLAYLHAGCVSAVVARETDGVREASDAVEQYGPELLYIGRGVEPVRWQEWVEALRDERSVCVVAGIHASDEARRCWARLPDIPRVFVTYDLYDYGLLFFDSTKQKQHYIVNF